MSPSPPSATVLHLAVSDGDLATTKMLIAAGVDVQVADALGNTALVTAITTKHASGTQTSVIQSLVKAGGKDLVNKKNKDGDTALHWAGRESNQDVWKILCASGANQVCHPPSVNHSLALLSTSPCSSLYFCRVLRITKRENRK